MEILKQAAHEGLKVCAEHPNLAEEVNKLFKIMEEKIREKAQKEYSIFTQQIEILKQKQNGKS